MADTRGNAPESPEAFGWEIVQTDKEGFPTWRGHGRRICWVKDEHIYLDQNAAYSEVQKLASSQHATIPPSQTSLWKRLDEAGKIAIRDDKEHITTKVQTAEGRKRAICLRLADVVELPEPGRATSQLRLDDPVF